MRSFVNGFWYAARGVAAAIKQERNFRVHICVALYVLYFSTFYQLSRVQYALLCVVIAAVLALEMVNSAIERVVDSFVKEKNSTAKTSKDMAAGAVLIASVGAVFCGFLLFWNTEIFLAIIAYFTAAPWRLLLLAASLCLSVWFVFFWRRGKDIDEGKN